jgi:hypothetical protein
MTTRTTAPDERRARKQAAAFTPDPRHETLLALKVEDPAAFAALPLETRMASGYYESAKTAHERMQEDER